MELKQLTYFIQVTEDKSFSKAAKHLFLTQQALSKAIGNLEEELDVSLFHRTYTGLELTQFGALLYKKSLNIIKESSEIFTEINALKQNVDSKVTMVVSYGLIHELSSKLLSSLRKSYPDIELTIRDHPDIICEDIILEDKADLGCVVGPVDPLLFESVMLLSEDLYMLINKDNYLTKLDVITSNHLESQHYVLPTDDFKISQHFKSYCEKNGFTPNLDFVSNEISFLHRMVHFNQGITIVPEHDLPQLIYPNIVPIKFPNNVILEIHLIRRRDHTHSCASNSLWNFLSKR